MYLFRKINHTYTHTLLMEGFSSWKRSFSYFSISFFQHGFLNIQRQTTESRNYIHFPSLRSRLKEARRARSWSSGPGAAPGWLTHLCVHMCTQGPQYPVHNVTTNQTYVANNLCFPTDPPPAPRQISEELIASLHNPAGSHKQKHLVF